MGVVPGPIYKEILKSLRNEKVNGMLKTQADEVEYVKKRLKTDRE
jgi:rubrerythrin